MRRLLVGLIAGAVLAAGTGVQAHLITYKGTVAKVEGSRIQVKTLNDEGEEHPEPQWFSPIETTKILRGDTRVTLDEAGITVGERIVVIVNHRSDDDAPVVEVRLAEK
jgi:hypothetical protein